MNFRLGRADLDEIVTFFRYRNHVGEETVEVFHEWPASGNCRCFDVSPRSAARHARHLRTALKFRHKEWF